ncbi:hypothetical protein LTR35_002825 [Friedmanniomyces endolithicus]|nr:hypothetical protein LTS00_010090 [Friedmanniomyces endolithicus]KAK0289627.1 hypothetical protein LTR35_002825 [Friedmanniomyces endolithicus]KAK1019706.1 hypothetical protein LTR54_000349 [Friedmanniomyces endolithicus]KAK1060927.1 hypothetical protein LTR74_011503 [Friedmanniomyces endolithicus]
MSGFYIPSSTATTTSSATPTYASDDEDEDTLPYPAELPRSDFLASDFNPETYLSSLRNRHQTLEDLRSDLRARSQSLNQELLELVNGHYEEFLSLGGDLEGGGEKVEGVRVGALGFKRELEGIGGWINERLSEVDGLISEKRDVRREIGVGRGVLEVHERIGELEESLGIADTDEDAEEDDIDDDDGEVEGAADNTSSPAARRLQRHARQYILLTRMIDRIGSSHPFLQAQQTRMIAIRKTLLLDLAAALRQAKSAQEPDAILSIVRLFGDLGAEKESVRVLKGG